MRIRRSTPLVLLLALLAGPLAAEERPVYDSPEDVQPLQPGSQVPSAAVRRVTGESLDLASLVAERGAMLVFYRGGWWPYCNTQLGELRKVREELEALGFRVIAFSPDRPEKMTKSLEVTDLGYELYSDSDLAAARALGIAFQLGTVQAAAYKGYGIDLEEASGRDHHWLPVPSVFLVEAGGTIRWVYSNPDYKVRPDNEAVLEAARRWAAPREEPAEETP